MRGDSAASDKVRPVWCAVYEASDQVGRVSRPMHGALLQLVAGSRGAGAEARLPVAARGKGLAGIGIAKPDMPHSLSARGKSLAACRRALGASRGADAVRGEADAVSGNAVGVTGNHFGVSRQVRRPARKPSGPVDRSVFHMDVDTDALSIMQRARARTRGSFRDALPVWRNMGRVSSSERQRPARLIPTHEIAKTVN
jgi:hypothetical protein